MLEKLLPMLLMDAPEVVWDIHEVRFEEANVDFAMIVRRT